MIPFFLLTFSLLTFSLLPLSATAETFPVVRRAYPPLQRRLDFIGAAPLRSQGCPSDLQDCGNDSMNWCCPKTTKCVSSFCCPTENRCDELVKTTPSCANPEYGLFTWTNKLWGVQYFCCKKGELGYLTTSGNRGSEACGKPPLGVASSLMATAVSASVTASPDSGSDTKTATGGAAKLTTKTMTAAPVATTILTTAANGDVSTITSTIPGSVIVSTSTADAPTSSSLGDTKKSMGTGTIVGIVVGVIGLALLGLAVWLGIRHGKKTAAAAAAPAGAGGYVQPSQPVYPTQSYTNVKDGVVEKDGDAYAPTSDVRELSGEEVRR